MKVILQIEENYPNIALGVICISAVVATLLWPSPEILAGATAQEEVEKLIYIEKGILRGAIVDFAFDGDTIKIHDEEGFAERVRLLGIDAPEVGRLDEGTFDEPFAQAAKDFTFQLVGKTVALYVSKDENQQKDKYERTLGVIIYQDEVFNTKLLENGLATRLFLGKNDLINYPAWEAKEVAARIANRGLWRNIGSENVVINELNPNPKVADAQGEFVELYNRNPKPVDVSRWTFGDGKESIIPVGTVIPSRGYLILARVSPEDFRETYPHTPEETIIIRLKGLILQNSSAPPQGLVKHLKDANKAYQDSLTYNLKWDGGGADNTGRSLERVRMYVANVGDSAVGGMDDKNWDASIEPLGTPGRRNSVSPYPRWDVNEDGVVDISDLVLVGQHFGEDYRDRALPMSAIMLNSDAKAELFQNYPNPFNSETWIPYRLSQGDNVILEIYAATGQLVRRIELGHRAAGFYIDNGRAIHWDGCNNDREKVTSGPYFYIFRAGLFTASRQMLLVK